jgi:hemoglobin/transferrin/lactoferrin receptor protein
VAAASTPDHLRNNRALGAVMTCERQRVRALLLGASTISLMASSVLSPAGAQNVITLDPITVLATKTPETTTESLAAVSSVRQGQIERTMPSRPSDILSGIPGVWVQERVDDPGTAVNIRGLQDFGRVAVVIDGARQNFQRTGHNADGVFYLEPELLSGVDVVRGPVANIYGSGAIGGVVSFTTKDVDDVLRPGQRWGVLTRGEVGSNEVQGVGSAFGAVRLNDNAEFMIGGTYRDKSDYKDGDGDVIPNTGYDVRTAIAKLTVRPADGHQVKFGYIDYESTFVSGQPFVPTTGMLAGLQASSIFDSNVRNQLATGRWTYSEPDNRVFDFDGSAYWTRTGTDQTKIAGLPPRFGGIGNIGDLRNFTIDTIGFDVHNNSRFDTGPLHHTLTIGGDAFRDSVDTNGFGVVFTPSGERHVSGAFAQLQTKYSTWLEVISAVRYDNYGLDGGSVSASGDRISPKITVGITPVAGITPYVTYAEGYRAPAVTETLIAGVHPVVFAPFQFLANPTLRPEVGKNKEAGINLHFDNVLVQGDGFRGKFNVFRNDVDDFIELTAVPFGQTSGGFTCPVARFGCQQYKNIPGARLEGAEFEMTYDAGSWFGGLAGSHVSGRNIATGAPLAKIAPDSVTGTLGARFLDRKLTVAVRWQWVDAKPLSEIPTTVSAGVATPVFPPTDAYNLINLYAGYDINPDVQTLFSVENLLNVDYARYLSAFPNPSGSGAPIAMPSPGITFRGALKIRFGEDFLKSIAVKG